MEIWKMSRCQKVGIKSNLQKFIFPLMNEFPRSWILDTEIVGRLLRIELHGPGRDIRSPVSVLNNIRDKMGYMFSIILDNIGNKTGIYILQYPSYTILEIRWDICSLVF